MNKLNSFINKQIELFFNQTKKKKKSNIFLFDPLVKLLNSKRGMLHYQLHCYVSSPYHQSTLHCFCFISFPSVHTLLIMFYFYFFQSTVDLIHFTYHIPSCSYLPYLVVFILHGRSASLSVLLFSQSNLWKLMTYKCL